MSPVVQHLKQHQPRKIFTLILAQTVTHSILENKDSFNLMDVSTASTKNTVLNKKYRKDYPLQSGFFFTLQYPDTLFYKEVVVLFKYRRFIYENKIVGKHNGYFNFTIGQRKGINVALGFPVYVKEIDPQSNTVYLCREEDIYLSEFSVKNINYQKYESVPDGFECEVKVRYRSCSEKCKIYIQNNIVTVKLESPQKSICPGQSAVFYEGNDVVLGGIIT